MLVTLLILMIGGIGLAQAVSSPNEVTLRWLRLGGLVAIGLTAVAAVMQTAGGWPPVARAIEFAFVAAACIVQLLTIQLGWRRIQRGAAFALFAAAVVAAVGNLRDAAPPDSGLVGASFAAVYVAAALDAGLVGGTLMTMLLGHAYLTSSNEMSQRPFRRLVIAAGTLIVVHLAVSILFGIRPFMAIDAPGRSWVTMLIAARLLVGLVAPAVFTWMVHDCVRRRANQSATGILYVTLIVIIIGQGLSFELYERTGLVF